MVRGGVPLLRIHPGEQRPRHGREAVPLNDNDDDGNNANNNNNNNNNATTATTTTTTTTTTTKAVPHLGPGGHVWECQSTSFFVCFLGYVL